MEYIVRVFTGDVWGAGTDANIFLNLYGENGDTGERELKDSQTNINKFERKAVRLLNTDFLLEYVGVLFFHSRF